MASEKKTQPTAVDPMEFIAAVENETRRSDALLLIEIYREETGEQPVMWGPSIIGFGTCHYKYASGHEGDTPAAGFSPRKAQMVVYLMSGYEEVFAKHLAELGPYKAGKSCLYLGTLAKVNMSILRQLIQESYQLVTSTSLSR